MQLTKSTISTLRSFATIVNHIIIDPGNVIATMSTNKNIIARAEVEDIFDKQFAVWDLVRFLNIMSLFESPSISFLDNGKQAKISEGSLVIDYTFAEPSIFEAAPKNIKPQEELAKFELTKEMFVSLTNAVKIMGLDRVVIKGDGKKLHLAALNSEGATKDKYDVIVGDTEQEFEAIINHTNLLMIPDTYNVSVSNRVVNFTSLSNKLTYWLVIEKNSKFS